MSRDQMERLLEDFGKLVEIPELKFDEDGYCCLFFDDIAINLELDEEENRLYIYSHIGRVPEENKRDFYEMLLKANYFCFETQGGTLGINDDAEVVMLTYHIPFSVLDLTQFETLFGKFADLAKKWKQKIKDFDKKEERQEKQIKGDMPNGLPTGIKV